MSGVSLPVTRPSSRALLVSNPASRAAVVEAMEKLGFGCAEYDDPYAAMAELCRAPAVYKAMILSLASLYREELTVVRTIKRRFPHTEVWLTHTDGRQGALADAMRLGADGLIDDEGLHRIAMGVPPAEDRFTDHTGGEALDPDERRDDAEESDAHDPDDSERSSNEPILSADELRALLQEQPSMPPAGDEQG